MDANSPQKSNVCVNAEAEAIDNKFNDALSMFVANQRPLDPDIAAILAKHLHELY